MLWKSCSKGELETRFCPQAEQVWSACIVQSVMAAKLPGDTIGSGLQGKTPSPKDSAGSG